MLYRGGEFEDIRANETSFFPRIQKGVPVYGKAEKNLDGSHELQPS